MRTEGPGAQVVGAGPWQAGMTAKEDKNRVCWVSLARRSMLLRVDGSEVCKSRAQAYVNGEVDAALLMGCQREDTR